MYDLRVEIRRARAMERFKMRPSEAAWMMLVGWDRAACKPAGKPVAVCGCELAYAPAQFRALDLCGVQSFDGEHTRLELRHCVCGSTIGCWIDQRGDIVDEVQP